MNPLLKVLVLTLAAPSLVAGCDMGDATRPPAHDSAGSAGAGGTSGSGGHLGDTLPSAAGAGATSGIGGGTSGGSGPYASGAAGGASGTGGALGDEAGCLADGENVLCAPSGFPFVTRTFAVTDACAGSGCLRPNPTLSQPDFGKLCLSGTVPANERAGFPLVLLTTTPDFAKVLDAFDAAARGITSVAFTLEAVPEGGIIVDAGISPEACEGTFPCGLGFALPRISGDGAVVVPLANFRQGDPASPYQTLDTTSLSHIGFTVGGGPFDFCLSKFAFLDAAGNEVKP